MEFKGSAIGSVETIGLVAAVAAADAGCKAARVVLLGRENPRGGGMMVVKFAGDVASVQASVQAAVAEASRVGKVVSWSVIARPDEEVAAAMGRGRDTFLSAEVGVSSPYSESGPRGEVEGGCNGEEAKVAVSSTEGESVLLEEGSSVGATDAEGDRGSGSAVRPQEGEPNASEARPAQGKRYRKR